MSYEVLVFFEDGRFSRTEQKTHQHAMAALLASYRLFGNSIKRACIIKAVDKGWHANYNEDRKEA